MSHRIGWAGIIPIAVLLVGCAGAPASPAADTATPTPTPTAACPQVEGVELPPECAPYDPDAAMAQNDLYRERMDLSASATAAAEALAEPLRTSLETVRTSEAITADDVSTALEDAGLRAPQVREASGDVLFGAVAPEGGCVFGAVTAEAVTVEVGGFINDGGCLPAQ